LSSFPSSPLPTRGGPQRKTCKEILMKLIVKTSKPRNPLVAPSLRRKAGSHRASAGAQRRQATVQLRRELERLIRPSP
jgi:hypothetical protein